MCKCIYNYIITFSLNLMCICKYIYIYMCVFGCIPSIKFNMFKPTCHTSHHLTMCKIHLPKLEDSVEISGSSPKSHFGLLHWLSRRRSRSFVPKYGWGWCGSGWFWSPRRWWLWDHSMLIQVCEGLSPSTCGEWFFECLPLARLHALLRRDGMAPGPRRLGCLGGLWITGLHAAVAAANGILADCAIVCPSPHHRGVFTDPWAVVGGESPSLSLFHVCFTYISLQSSTRFSPRDGMINDDHPKCSPMSKP